MMRKDVQSRRFRNVAKRIRYIIERLPMNISGLKILDCGCSFGFIALTLRSCFDGISIIDGVDIWKPLRSFHGRIKLYDKVYIMGLKDFVDKHKDLRYDYIIMGDVLEHMEKEESLYVLKKIMKMVNSKVIVNVPFTGLRQGDYRGNPYQAHISKWVKKDLEDMGFECITYDPREMTRLTLLFDSVRRFIFGKKTTPLSMVAWWCPVMKGCLGVDYYEPE